MRTKLLTFVLVAFHLVSRADEGMWMLPLIDELNIGTMTEMGLELTAEDIYSINSSSIKDAIVIFGRGCTAELISDEGLLITNHHCGYDRIQSHSTVEHDYLTDGFWAKNREEELINPGLEVTFLVRIEDVSDIILSALSDTLTEEQREDIISTVTDSLVNAATDQTYYDALVESFFNGNKYYLFVNEVYKDVRFVGAPPNSIGKFGHDTDNWMWPRHTGDFSMFRVYMAPDGTPAEYSEDNVPYKPKHYLPISMKGYEKGDFTMVLGYPGSTDRYLTSYELDEVMNITNKNRVKIRGAKQEIILKDMQADAKTRIQYASKYSRSSNYWKYSIGQNQGLKRLNVREKKQELEKNFQEWVDADEQRKEEYGDVLNTIKEAVESKKTYVNNMSYFEESLFTIEIIDLAYHLAVFLSKSDPMENDSIEVAEAHKDIQEYAEEFFKNYNVNLDKKVAAAMISLCKSDLLPQYWPTFFEIVQTKYKGDAGKFVEKMYDKSFMIDKDEFYSFIKSPDAKKLTKDMAFGVMISVLTGYHGNYAMQLEYDTELTRARRLYLKGLMEMQKDKVFYSDANFTMRLTYGSVQDYEPRDAVYYNYYTTLKGVMEKEDPDNYEFIVDQKLKDLYKTKDWSNYSSASYMPVCFTTTNDITGGNSGSPVLNGKGELLGLAFDGNWEAMSGDIAFEPELQRCICVDIRYVLFIIDKYAGASYLLDEMKLVN